MIVDVQAITEFEKKRRRKDGSFTTPILRYGPQQSHTLYVPSAKIEKRLIFERGRPRFAVVGSPITDPEIDQLRVDIIKSFRRTEEPGIALIDQQVIEYSARLLLINYDLSDDDLAMLHTLPPDGGGWINGIVRHVCGGEQMIELLNRIDPVYLVTLMATMEGNRVNGGSQPQWQPAVSEESPERSDEPETPVNPAAG